MGAKIIIPDKRNKAFHPDGRKKGYTKRAIANNAQKMMKIIRLLLVSYFLSKKNEIRYNAIKTQ